MALENVHSSIVNCSFLFDREMLEQSSGELDKTIADLEEKSNNVEDEGTNYYKHNYPKINLTVSLIKTFNSFWPRFSRLPDVLFKQQ